MPKRLDLLAYGPVGSWFGVSAQDMAQQLAAAPDAEEVVVRVHSEGGDALDGLAMSNALRAHAGRVVCYVDGLAASSASMLCMGADEIVMAENSMMMLHNPWGLAMGDGGELREQADALDAIGRAYVAGYARKSGRPEDEIKALMERYSWRTGVWMTAADAVREKLADRIGPPVQAQARATALRAAAVAKAPSALKTILAGTPAVTGARAAQNKDKKMTIKDWAARLRAATTKAARAAILAEMEKDEPSGEASAEAGEHEEPDGDEASASAEVDDDKDDDKDEKDDDEKVALRASVQALQAQLRDKSEPTLTPEAWTEKQIKAGYPKAQQAELLRLRQRRPQAAELAVATVLRALPQAKRGARWTEGGAPHGTTVEQAQPDAAVRAAAVASAKNIMAQANAALGTGRRR